MIKYVLNYKKIISVFTAFIIFLLSICTYSSNSSADNTTRSYKIFRASNGTYLDEYTLTSLPTVNNSRYIFGMDDRQIDWSKSGVVKLMSVIGIQGTGFVVDEHTIATAAHCVYNEYTGGGMPLTEIRLFDNNGNQTLSATPVNVHIPNAYIQANQPSDNYSYNFVSDYALIIVEEDLSAYACFNLAVPLDTINLSATNVTVTGFPEKINGEYVNTEDDDEMYSASGTLYQMNSNDFLHYVDTDNGNSGGPTYVTETRNGNTCYSVIGIYSATVGYVNDPNLYSASTRITTDLLHFYLNNCKVNEFLEDLT